MRKVWALLSVFFSLLALPCVAFAHEVYVLTPQEITESLNMPAFNMLAVIKADLSNFLFWAFLGILTVIAVFLISISRFLEERLDPFFERTRKYAAPIARVTVGLSFLAAAYYQASYGPELPLASSFGSWSGVITGILITIGILITLGVYARIAALVALILYAFAVWHHGWYMLTYTNYLGEILVLLILGVHHGIGPAENTNQSGFFPGLRRMYERVASTLAPYSMLLLRVCFGVSLLYASLYAKILHNNLALLVAELPLAGHTHGIAYYFGLEPHFMVLGAAIIEIVIALFFIFGIEIRFTALFLEFWLSLSLMYFGEVVWPHVILIGIPIAFICYGYDKYSLEGFFFKRSGFEPVL